MYIVNIFVIKRGGNGEIVHLSEIKEKTTFGKQFFIGPTRGSVVKKILESNTYYCNTDNCTSQLCCYFTITVATVTDAAKVTVVLKTNSNW